MVQKLTSRKKDFDASTVTKEQKIQAAWMRGLLSYKLDAHQLPIHKAVWDAINNKFPTYTINCSRQFGKSFTLLLVAFEYCIRNKGAQVRFAIPIASAYEEMYGLSLSIILEDVPEGSKPDHQVSKKAIFFPNGSHIKFAGTDGQNFQNLRGAMSHLNIIDEAAFCDNLEEVYEHVLRPQTTRTGGITIFCSTPPVTQDHYYVRLYYKDKERSRVSQFTIHDNTALSEEDIARIIEEEGPVTNSTFRRERLCEFVTDENLVIIKEWKPEFVEAIPKPQYYTNFHKYEGMDLGVVDNTVCLFGYYNFIDRTLVIEDELVMSGPSLVTPKLADEIKIKEKTLWDGLTPAENNPYRRIADSNNKQMLQDLIYYGLSFIPVRKTKPGPDQPNDTKQSILNGMINKVRVMVGQGRVRINPKCKQLIGCMEFATWNKQKTEFDRSAMFGHYDALAALIYMVKMLDEFTNPVPNMLNIRPSTHYIPKNQPQERTQTANSVVRLFNPRSRL